MFYVLDSSLTPIPPPKDDDCEEIIAQRKKREEDEFMRRGRILNTLSDCLYNLYTVESSAKKFWNALEFKYKAEEECTKKFLVSKYFEFKFNDDMPILAQVHELQVIVNQLRVARIELPASFQVGAIITKLPASWKGYMKKILHDSKDFSLEEIQKHLRIEEESRERDKNENSYSGNNKANALNKPSIKSNKEKQRNFSWS
ncbi:uncharacterized protein LOC132066334 [Lycium ferocissimum]|uniref:uncharacterized protein LOC132066334 n=1 Tax=Lycium ferocissimum TaxID=112874 RepID=UPI0028161E25|nr:uncharacterized protein LOC132066334 [Lycium ferocissimum]